MASLLGQDNGNGFGVKGEGANGDGVIGSSNSSAKTGVFGINVATAPCPPGVPGGNGVFGVSSVPNASGVFGANDQGGIGVAGNSAKGDGVVGSSHSSSKTGVFGINDATEPCPPGIPGGNGVFGVSNVPNASGVFGANDHGGNGVAGNSAKGDGVVGSSHSASKTGVFGINDATEPCPPGIPGGNGVFGFSNVPNASGVFGANDRGGNGVSGNSAKGDGIAGFAHTADKSGVFGFNDGNGFGVTGASRTGIGILGRGGRLAGRFEGDVEVTGDVKLLGADCAEDFDVADPSAATPGTVMVLDDSGGVRASDKAYDTRVAGVVSGAGIYQPALILDRQARCENRRPLALIGKTFCKVDATDNPIAIGDLLTTSSTPGHAMKAVDQRLAFGAVIGKALQACAGARGLIPILVVLQ